MKETIITILTFLADHMGVIFGGFMAVLTLVAIIRIIVKAKRGEKVEITPVGIMNDLPESITGTRRKD